MTQSLSMLPYSFSMINLVNLMPEWCWDTFDNVMAQAGTNRVELVPSMMLGMNWDEQIYEENGPVQQALRRLMNQYSVGSIQSLTYGLQINLADHLRNHTELNKRLQALARLGKTTGCSILVLGSPGQKKQLDRALSDIEHKQRFMDNCSWIASTLGPDLFISLEHNTIYQGAEYCNTLLDIIDIVTTLRRDGTVNVGVNLDTKCLMHEYGTDVRVGDLLDKYDLADLATSIQVSYDFLVRDTDHCTQDQRDVAIFANTHNIPLSLEEFGLLGNQIDSFVQSWISL